MPCTASPEPVRSAASAPIEPKPSVISTDSAISTGTPAGPAAKPGAGRLPDREENAAWTSAQRDRAGELPGEQRRRRVSGVSERRERKPVSMSSRDVRARRSEANSAPWMNGTASAKVR